MIRSFNPLWALIPAIVVLLVLIVSVLFQFSFQYTDQDQVIMWFGQHEILEGNHYMPRYWGQNYGSMIEAYLSILFAFLPYHISLPLTSTLLMLLPYVLIGLTSNHKLSAGLVMVGCLLLLPEEYFLITMVPRDFVTGLALSSLALLFYQRKDFLSLFLTGFFCLGGWVFNQYAALLGAVISVLASFNDNGQLRILRIAKVLTGYGLAFLVWLALRWYDYTHPEMIVHKMWEFHYAWKQLWDGWTNLDRHWAWITPLLEGNGWFYILIWAFIVLVAYLQKRTMIIWAISVLFVITMLTFGILKVHDGYNSIFMSHDHAYLALPIATILLLSKLGWSKYALYPLVLLGIVYGVNHLVQLESSIKDHTQSDIPDRQNFHVIRVDKVYNDLNQLSKFTEGTNARFVVIGQYNHQFSYAHNYAGEALIDGVQFVSPVYDRKTWVMRTLASDTISRVLIVGEPKFIEENGAVVRFRNYNIEQVFDSECSFCFLVTADTVKALELYQHLGYSVSNH